MYLSKWNNHDSSFSSYNHLWWRLTHKVFVKNLTSIGESRSVNTLPEFESSIKIYLTPFHLIINIKIEYQAYNLTTRKYNIMDSDWWRLPTPNPQ